MKRLILAIAVFVAVNLNGAAAPEWKTLAPGLEITTFKAAHPVPQGKSNITVLRIDPTRWELVFAGVSQSGGASTSAKQWCARNKLTAAINAGMFQQDGRTHVGYLRSGDHVNSRRIASYQSVVAFGPHSDGKPPFHIFDLNKPAAELPAIAKEYQLTVQNLRLIQRPGVDKWHQDKKRASEAALGEDDAGRILFIFTRSPFTMYELNEELLKANIGLVAAQYLEGGPEAQLYVHAGQTEMEMFGSYETGFSPDDQNDETWPVPNVLGIRPKPSTNK
ncbi:MAG TPA: phosphodiester glycosidase family protein [Candidatus Angelobacter sp.]|jgi:exopolysaccharide biosynthesis protein|nr:phosphodiester glycosidase family protein [Candidatus Angelobacter sp.]